MDLAIMGVASNGPAMELLADSSGILILLAAAFLVFRTFRERYLLAWILGWSFYLVYRIAGSTPPFVVPAPWLMGISHAAFVAALAFFVVALLYYTNRMRLLVPVSVLALAGVDLAVAHAAWWPESRALMWTIRVVYTLMVMAGAVQLAYFCRGRRRLGAWLVVATLLLLHLDERPSAGHAFAGVDTAIELLLGVGMLMVVLDESKARTNRLTAVNRITVAIAQAQDYGSMVLTALEELQALFGAKASWFRLLDGNSLVLTQQVGLSEQYISNLPTLDTRVGFASRLMRYAKPGIVFSRTAEPQTQPAMQNEGIHHALVAPVNGKNTIIGVLGVGQAGARSYTPEEIRFLTITAKQVGIAVENLRLMEQIIRSHRQWISTFDSIEDLILVHDSRYRIVKVNRAVLQRLGHQFAGVVFQPCESVLPGGGDKWHLCPYCHGRDNFAEGPDPCFGGYSIVTSSTFTEQGGDFHGTIHIVRDTTERRAAEEKYRLLFEQAQEGVFISTPEGRVTECNDAFVHMLGYDTREQVMALDIARDIYLDRGQRERFCHTMNAHNYVRNYEVALRRKDGSIVYALENSFSTRDASGRVDRYQGFLLDITEKKRAEEQLLQSEKMSALGQLVSGVAHELNNPLTAILGYSQLLESQQMDERARDFVGKMFKQAQRTQKLVQNLLSFARQKKPKREQIDLRRVVQDTLELRDYDLKLNNIEVRLDAEPSLPAIVGDANQMEQVCLNIINNAVDAMLEAGGAGSLHVNIHSREGRVCVEFHDSGPGIREPKRVFDPFYTTKSVGKGTGLGLSICYGIIKEHGGEIEARNHPDGGALFRITLPATHDLATFPPEHAPMVTATLRGRILLVDDEEAVLEFEREALTAAGAEVVTVSSADQAMALLHRQRFDGLVVDCTMAGQCSGIDFYRWVAANCPGLERNIVFAISNIRDAEIRSFVEQERVPVVVKPFQVSELIAAMQSVLRHARAATAN